MRPSEKQESPGFSRGERQYPLFWLTDQSKADYVRRFSIQHSDCYSVWGFTRTGCVGCPFNRHVFEDLDTVERYEPNMARAARKVFEDAYAYTTGYKEYKRDREVDGQLRLF